MLTDAQIERYSRQIILPSIGGQGQHKLLDASVALAGGSGLATTAAHYLAAAGVGTLTVFGRDRVEGRELASLNPDCHVTEGPQSLTADLVAHLARTHTVVIDANAQPTPNLSLNAACVAFHRPLLWARAVGHRGELAVFAGHRADAPCADCRQASSLVHADRPSAREEPASSILASATAAFVGSVAATEAIKLILAAGTAPVGRRLSYDALAGDVAEETIRKDPRCNTCRPRRTASMP